MLTIGALRKRLDELESNWTPEEDKYMGKFEHQAVCVPVFVRQPGSHLSEFRGYSPEAAVFWDGTGLGLMIEDDVDWKIRNALEKARKENASEC